MSVSRHHQLINKYFNAYVVLLSEKVEMSGTYKSTILRPITGSMGLHLTPLHKVLTSLGVFRISMELGKFGASVAGIISLGFRV